MARTVLRHVFQQKSFYLLVFACCIAICMCMNLTCAHPAYAQTQRLDVGARIEYGGYNTHWMYVAGNIAYCANPEKQTPNSGLYTKKKLSAPSKRIAELRSALWFGYGGPGFDPKMWPSKWYDGSKMTKARYAALTHIVVSQEYAASGTYALSHTNEKFKKWVFSKVLAHNSLTNKENPRGKTIQSRIRLKKNQIPKHFEVFKLHTGTEMQEILSFAYTPLGSISLSKVSGNPDISQGNRCYSLAGALYGVWKDSACTQGTHTVLGPTNSAGKAHLCSSDDNGNATAHLAPGTYYVKEVTAVKGYALDKTIYTVVVRADTTTSVNTESGAQVSDLPQSDPGDACIQKVDAETGNTVSVRSGTLAGAEFTVKYFDTLSGKPQSNAKRTWVYTTNGDGRIDMRRDAPVRGDSTYHNSKGEPTFPLGTYTVQETKAPAGYLADPNVYTQTITPGGEFESIHCFASLDNNHAIREQIQRGDFEFVKQDAKTGEAMANVAFLIRNNESGEQHVIVTDKHGAYSSNASHAPHASHTNENDKALGKDGAIQNAALSPANGIWFGLCSDGSTTAPNNSLGALPYGTYTLTELPCEANVGHKLASPIQISIDHDGIQVKLGVIPNEPAVIHTVLTSQDSSKVTPATKDIELVDTISYENLTPHAAYTMHGELHVRANHNGSAVDEGAVCDAHGDPLCATTKFTPESESGTTEVHFIVDASALQGKELVAFETCKRADRTVATHADIASGDQMVSVPSVQTELTDKKSGSHEILAKGSATLTDTVTYQGLQPGTEHTLESSLVYRDSGDVVVDTQGNKAIVKNTFTPESPEGTQQVSFDVDASALQGRTVVAYERIYKGGVLYASHEDITDKFQSVSLPRVKTTATVEDSKDHQAPAKEHVHIEDAIQYENLTPHAQYTITGTLHVTNPDGSDGGELKDAGGSPVTTSETFTPDDSDGTVTLSFDVDTSILAGQTIVAFEEITRDSKLVALHTDITDENQSVHVPKISTTATDASDGDHEVIASASTTVYDDVAYENLEPNRPYKLSGTLHRVGEDGSDQGVLTDAQGFEVSVETTFTPKKTSGTERVEFSFDATDMQGMKTVAFEQLRDGDTVLATHEDITSEGQTISYTAPDVSQSPHDVPDRKEHAPMAKTGQDAAIFAILGTCVLAASVILVRSRRQK